MILTLNSSKIDSMYAASDIPISQKSREYFDSRIRAKYVNGGELSLLWLVEIDDTYAGGNDGIPIQSRKVTPLLRVLAEMSFG